MTKGITLKIIIALSLAFGMAIAQTEPDAIEKARQAKEAADKAAEEAAAATEAAIEAAATKAAEEAREDAKRKKAEEEARKIAEAQAAEEAELDAAASAAAEEAKRKMAEELGLEYESSTPDSAESDSLDLEDTESDSSEMAESVEAKEALGYNIGLSGSFGFVQGSFFENIPTGASIVISTPWGFNIGGMRFGLSGTIGAYPAKHNTGVEFTPLAFGLGGNLTLVNLVFAEGHVGMVGDAVGARGFAGISLEYLMKKGLNLPVNILVGGEGFFSTKLKEGVGAEAPEGSASYWGGLAVRLDYNF